MPIGALNNKCSNFVERIGEQVKCGIFSVGDRLPAERILCEQYGLSRTTVRNGLAILEQQGIVCREGRGCRIAMDALQHLEVLPGTETILCVMLPDQLTNPIFRAIFRTVERQLGAARRLQVCFWSEQHREAPELPERPAAILVFGNRPEAQLALLEPLTPFVILVNAQHPRLPWVAPDNYAGGRLLAEHLYEAGHRKISAFFLGETSHDEFSERYFGARDYLWQQGITLNPMLPVQRGTEESNCEFFQRSFRLLRQREQPTAILAQRDELALAIYDLPLTERPAIPAELSIVGFDDIFYASYMIPALTTVRYPAEAIGQETAILLQELWSGSANIRQRKIMPCLFSRQSVKTLPLSEVNP